MSTRSDIEYLASQVPAASAVASLDEIASEESLLEFMRRGWHCLEPGAEFVTGWAVEAICHHLQAVTEGQIRNLLINCPPGFTKSMAVSVFWPAWEWGPRRHPDYRYIRASHTLSNAHRDNLRCKDLVGHEWYKDKWGHVMTPRGDKWGEYWFINQQTGWQYAASVKSDITGKRGDRIILDDPNSVDKTEDEPVRERTLRWFTETLPHRVNKQGESPFVVVMQRVHERDVSGHILAAELDYTHLMIPMEFEPERKCYTSIVWREVDDESGEVVEHDGWEDPRSEEGELAWPERFSRDAIDELADVMRSWGGEYAVAGQLQQRPAPRGGGLFKKSDFSVVPMPMHPVVRTVRGWDLAATKDGMGAQTAAVKMGMDAHGNIYIMHCIADRWSPAQADAKIRGIAEADGHNVIQDLPQDPGAAGKHVKTSIAKLLQGYQFHVTPESGSKEDRARPLASQVESGNVYIIEGSWNDAYLNEMAAFPSGALKDRVDASSRAYARLIAAPPEGNPEGMAAVHFS